MVEAQRMNVST